MQILYKIRLLEVGTGQYLQICCYMEQTLKELKTRLYDIRYYHSQTLKVHALLAQSALEGHLAPVG